MLSYWYRQDVDAVDSEMQWQRAIEEEVQEAKYIIMLVI